MSDTRTTLIWLAAGVLGMFGLAMVMRFGVAVGLVMIVAVSTPTLVGNSVRPQLVALSGLLTGFGLLWLLIVAGEAVSGVALHSSVAGHVMFGICVVALGILLGLWHLTSRRSADEAPTRRLAAGERPAYWVRADYWDRSAQWSHSPRPVPVRAGEPTATRRPPPV